MAKHVLRLRPGTASDGGTEKDRRKLTIISDFILYQSGTICVVLTTLFVWPFLGRILSPILLGELSFQLATASILAPALCLGAHLYLANRMASRRDLGIQIEARTAVALTFTLYTTSLLAIGSSFLFDSQDVLISVGLSCAISAYLVTSGVMRGIDRPKPFGVLVFCVQVLGLVGLGWGAATTGELRSGIVIYVMMIGIPVLAQHLMLKEQKMPASWRSMMSMLGKSARLVPHLVLAVALLMMMRVLVAVQLGNQAAANYTFASLIIGGSITIGASLDAHWSVRAQASKTMNVLTTALSRNQCKTQVILLVSSAGVSLFLFLGLGLWLPADYDSVGVSVAVICSLPAASLQAIADGRAAVLMWTNKPGLVSVSTALGTLVTIALAYFLLPIYGWAVLGAVLTAGLSVRAVLTTLSSRLICPQSRVGTRNLALLFAQFVFAAALFSTT